MTRLMGIRTDLAIPLTGTDWNEMTADLAVQLGTARTPAIEKGAHVGLESGDPTPSPAELERLVWLLEMHDVKLDWWKRSVERDTRRTSTDKASLATAPTARTGHVERSTDVRINSTQTHAPKLWTEAALVSQTLRAGQIVRNPGSVIVLGDVNAGAVLVADGSVLVWGRLRGAVHAGAGGDEKAVVGALELAPSQLRIGGLAARASDVSQGPAVNAEIAIVLDGRIVIYNWDDEKP